MTDEAATVNENANSEPEGPWIVWAYQPATLHVPVGVTGLEPGKIRAPKYPDKLGGLKTRRIVLQKGPNVLCARASSWGYRDVAVDAVAFKRDAAPEVVGVRHTIGEILGLTDELTGEPEVELQELALLKIIRWLATPGHPWTLESLFKPSRARAPATLTLMRLDQTKRLDSGVRRRYFTFARDRGACGVVHDWAVLHQDWSTVEAARERAQIWFGGPA